MTSGEGVRRGPVANSGFSSAHADDLVVPVVTDGPFSYQAVNVTDQRRVPESMLVWFELMLHTLRECQEIGVGRHQVVTTEPDHVLVHRVDAASGTMLFVHNLADKSATVSIPVSEQLADPQVEIFQDHDYCDLELDHGDIAPYGYRWIRLRRDHAHT
jgi:maltose alpha-D-glucosyltransferase/alpha-amylase